MSKQFVFKKIDAFATKNSTGNPAGYIWLDAFDQIEPDEMQRIARELKGFVSEVGFISPIEKDTFRLKYYSAEREVEFCGHATIAMMYDILKNSPDLSLRPEITIITNRGTLGVENLIATHDAVFIMAPEPMERPPLFPIADLTEALQVEVHAISERYKVSIVNAGLETLIVPIRTLKELLAIRPELEVLKQFCIRYDIDIIEVFCDEVSNPQSAYRTRVFAPTFGYLEDPATGSGNSAFGYYLLSHHHWNGEPLTLEQNAELERHNVVRLKTGLDTESRQRVFFGGGAVTRIEGRYLLP